MSNIGGKSIIERFKPRVSLAELEYAIGDRNLEITDDDYCALAKELLNAAVPSHEDPYERRWEYFLLPLRRAGKVIVLTFSVVEYRERFYFHFPRLGGFSIGPGGASMRRHVSRTSIWISSAASFPHVTSTAASLRGGWRRAATGARRHSQDDSPCTAASGTALPWTAWCWDCARGTPARSSTRCGWSRRVAA